MMFDTAGAITYLKNTHGIDLPKQSLPMMRFKGTGPAFTKLGRLVYYTQENLDSWVTNAIEKQTFKSTATLKRGKAA